MRRATVTVIALTVAVALSGCGLVSSLAGIGPAEPDPSAELGSCLDGLNGADSDRTSVVDCDEPHLFEVTDIAQWPGMADAIAAADGDLGAVWDDIHTGEGPDGAEYAEWASRTCNEAAQRTVGIHNVEVDGHSAGDLWLRVGGTHGVDLSLASRDGFVDRNDLSTYCSMAWYDGDTPLLLASPPFERLLQPGLDAGMRECWAQDYSVISCEEPHAAQVLLGFEGLEAFGPEVIARVATGTSTDEDWNLADGFCDELLQQALPQSADFGELGYLAETAASASWDEFDGTVDPDGGYWYSCIAVPFTDDDFTGDVFDGTVAVGSGA